MKVNATTRSVKGTGASRRLRRAGRVPAVLYGGNKPAASLELDHNEIYHSLRKDEFHASVLDIMVDGKKESAVLRTAQWHAYKQQVLHVDFLRINADEEITIRVPVAYLNADDSPAVKISHQVISQVTTELDIRCLPSDLPTSIEVDLINLEANENIYLSGIELPKGVVYAGLEEDPVLVAALGRRGPAGGDEAEDADSTETEAGSDSEEQSE